MKIKACPNCKTQILVESVAGIEYAIHTGSGLDVARCESGTPYYLRRNVEPYDILSVEMPIPVGIKINPLNA